MRLVQGTTESIRLRVSPSSLEITSVVAAKIALFPVTCTREVESPIFNESQGRIQAAQFIFTKIFHFMTHAYISVYNLCTVRISNKKCLSCILLVDYLLLLSWRKKDLTGRED